MFYEFVKSENVHCLDFVQTSSCKITVKLQLFYKSICNVFVILQVDL